MNLNKLVLIVSITAVVCSAMAQGGGGRRGGQRGFGPPTSPGALLNRADVQKDLGITDDQKQKLTDIRTASRQAMTDARTNAGDDRAAQMAAMQKIGEDTAAKSMAVLTPDQQKRAKEIFMQVAGTRAVLNKDVQSDLGISADQKSKIDDLVKRQTAANQEIMQKQRDQSIDAQEARAERTKNEQVLTDEINKILTDDQKSKMKDMGGKPFTADPPAGGGGGGGRAGGGF